MFAYKTQLKEVKTDQLLVAFRQRPKHLIKILKLVRAKLEIFQKILLTLKSTLKIFIDAYK